MRKRRVGWMVMLLVVGGACGEEGRELAYEEVFPSTESGEMHSRRVLLVDSTGGNSALVTLWSPDAELLEEISPEDLRLVPVVDEYSEGEEASGEDSFLRTGEVFIELQSEVLAEGVIGLEVVEPTPPSYRAPFKWRFDYSRLDCVHITRAALWHPVHAAIAYRNSPGAPWRTLINHRILSPNETLTRCVEGSYMLKVGTWAQRAGHAALLFWSEAGIVE